MAKDNIKDNIKELRQALRLTQQQFAAKIGMQQNSIALIESGKRNISEQALRSISREFKVRLEWLKTGEGDMYEKPDVSILERLKAEYELSPKSLELIVNFLKLPPETRDLVAEGIAQAAKLYPRKPDSELTPDEAAEVVRHQRAVELAAQKREVTTSSASTGTSGTSKKIGKVY